MNGTLARRGAPSWGQSLRSHAEPLAGQERKFGKYKLPVTAKTEALLLKLTYKADIKFSVKE